MVALRNASRVLLFTCFATLLLATGVACNVAMAERGREAAILSKTGPLDDVQLSLEPDPFDNTAADPVHPWDNNDYSDTSAAGDPGRLQRKSTHTPPDPFVLVTVEAQRSFEVIPEKIGMLVSYPNPFNAQTRIEFQLGVAGAVRLEVYNLLGQLVQRVDWANLPAGRHSWTWDGSDASRRTAPSGVYFARIEVGGSSALHKMVLLK